MSEPKYTQEDFTERMICVPIEDFVATEFSYTYIIDPILPAGGIACIHGKGGSGKTQLLFSMIKSIVQGTDFLGKWPTRKGKVIYFQFDMPHALYADRWRKALQGLDPGGMIHTVPWRGINIMDDSVRDEVGAMIAEVNPALIVIDTLRKCHHLDENDNAVPSIVYGAWKEIMGNAAIEFIHHDKKSFSQMYRGTIREQHNWLEGFRGARAWVDDAELGLSVFKPDQKKNRILLRTTKHYCAPEHCPDEILKLNPVTLLAEPIWTTHEWAQHYAYKEGIRDQTKLTKLVEVSAEVSNSMASRAAKDTLEHMQKLGLN